MMDKLQKIYTLFNLADDIWNNTNDAPVTNKWRIDRLTGHIELIWADSCNRDIKLLLLRLDLTEAEIGNGWLKVNDSEGLRLELRFKLDGQPLDVPKQFNTKLLRTEPAIGSFIF